MKFNKKSRDLILSIAWGDGYVSKQGDVIIKHSVSQSDYVYWKRHLLSSNGIKVSDIVQMNNGKNDCQYFRINVTPYGKLLRRIFYKDGYKNIYQRKLLKRITPQHLAIWYMDDGGLSQLKRNGNVVGNELMLNTHTTKENNQILINYFLEVWGIKFSQVKNRGWYRLRCGTKEARKFIKIVEFYVSQIPSMAHKLNVKPERDCSYTVSE